MKKLTLSSLAAATMLTMGTAQAVEIGGYGELHYNNVSNEDNTRDDREIDFHRFVLFFNQEFSDNIRFFSELELEHSLAGDGAPGEVELEQAFVEIDLNENNRFKAGVFLVPIGILNETHEPPTFYGTERNNVESRIIPSTWWEGGIGLSGEFGEGFSYDIALHSGLNATADDGDLSNGNSALVIRSARQKVAEAVARNLAATGRIKYTGVEGLELALSVNFQDDLTQDPTDNVEGAVLVETHARYTVADLTLTGLYARWDIDVSNPTVAQSGRDEQDGFYVEASYKLSEKWGVFARQSAWTEDQDVDAAEQTDIGVNYWPHENVVFKFDVQDRNEEGGDLDGFNLGVGYQF